jgi:hypothetical protein
MRYKISVIRLLFVLTLSINYQTLRAQTTDKQYRNNYLQQEPWYLYPLSIQVSPHFGFIMPMTLLDITTNRYFNTPLLTIGGKVDINLLYPRRWFLEHFDCYPKVGLIVKYYHIINQNIDEKGNITGGVLYLEPNYKLLNGWEVLPKFGIGMAYVNIPGTFSPIKQDAEEEDDSINISEIEPFRKEPSLNIIFDLLIKYRLTPHWQLYFSIGADILPQFKTSSDSDKDSNTAKIRRSIELYTASLGCSYTFNPADYNPIRKPMGRKSRIDLTYLSSFRRALDFAAQVNPGDDGKDKSNNKFYYIGGLHIQWSLQLLGNHAIVLASEWIKDLALKQEVAQSLRRDNLQASAMIGHEFLWGKLIFGQYAGMYLLNNAPNDASRRFGSLHNLLYGRLGLIYKITDYLHIGANLKISLFPASPEKKAVSVAYTRIDYLDFRIGYSF